MTNAADKQYKSPASAGVQSTAVGGGAQSTSQASDKPNFIESSANFMNSTPSNSSGGAAHKQIGGSSLQSRPDKPNFIMTA